MRKLQLVKYAVESRYFRLLLISIILPTLLLGACLYYFIFMVLAENLGIPETIAEHLLPVIHQINGLLLFGLPLIILLITGWGLIIFTRLVGPIDRVKKELDRIIKGNYSERIKIRKGDDLKPVVDGINKLLDRIEAKQKTTLE